MEKRAGYVKKILLLLVIACLLPLRAGEIKAEDSLWENEQGEWGTDSGSEMEEETGEWNNDYYGDGESLLQDDEKGYWQQGGFSDSPEESYGNENNGNQTTGSRNTETAESPGALKTETQTPEEAEVTPVPMITVIPGITETSGVTVTPEITITPDITPAPETTAAPGITITPGITPTPGITEIPEVKTEKKVPAVPGLYFWSEEIKTGSQAEILINPGTEIELISVRVNGKEQSWKRYGNKVFVKLDQQKESYMELTFLCAEDLSWTERKNNVILCYNIL